MIGKVHESSIPALKNLQAEGFTLSNMVDIFDAGPCVSCPRDEIRTVRQSRTAVVEQIVSEKIESCTYMIGRFSPAFAATIGPLRMIDANRVCLDAQVAAVLGVSAGSQVRYASLRPDSSLAAARSTAGSARSSKNILNDSD